MPLRWYDVGAVTVTHGSPVVVGAGCAWTMAVRVADGFQCEDGRLYEIASVDSDTRLTLRRPYRGETASGAEYTVIRNFDASVAGDLTGRVSDLVLRHDARDREWRDWIGGSPAGGPNGDGRYVVHDGTGAEVLVRCPATWGSGGGGAGGVASIIDHGADPTGAADSTNAIRAALAAAGGVLVPPGRFRITDTIQLGYGQALIGVGERSVIQAREAPYDHAALPDYPSDFNAVELVDGYALVENLRIVGGASGVKIYGATGPAVRNVVRNVSIWDARNGITLDGYITPDRPCYWNWITDVFIGRPAHNGVLLTVETNGDTPNANKFTRVRVYSLAAPLSGCGFFLSAARFHNAFTDCEANLHPGGQACFRLGAFTDETCITNFYAESLGALPAIRIDNGSQRTSIVNLFSATAGAPIWDTSEQRNFVAVNAGVPEGFKNRFENTVFDDARFYGVAFDTEFVELGGGGETSLSVCRASCFLVSAYGGATRTVLPKAANANGRRITIKKTDLSGNPVTVVEQDGPGPDYRDVPLFNRFDYVVVASNGANWWIVGGNVMPGNTRFIDGTALYRPDCSQTLYLVSAFGGPCELRLPHPGASHVAGRTVTIKKHDPSGNRVTVTAEGVTGPDGVAIALTQQGDFLSVTSNGAAWVIVNRFRV